MSNAFYHSAEQYSLRRVVPDLVQGRQILVDLITKELRARYRYAMIGFLWAILEPLFLTTILAIVFTFVFQIRGTAGGVPQGPAFAAFILTGLIPWQFFAGSLSAATNSLVDNSPLVSKVSFPRELIPLATIGNALVNFLIGYLLVLGVFALLVQMPGIGAIWMLLIFTIEIALVIGLALLLSCANVFFRDVAYIVNVVMMFGFYATPIFYPPDIIHQRSEWLYATYLALNPMACLITSYRTVLWDNTLPDWRLVLWPAVIAAVLVVLGAWVFRRNSPIMADNL